MANPTNLEALGMENLSPTEDFWLRLSFQGIIKSRKSSVIEPHPLASEAWIFLKQNRGMLSAAEVLEIAGRANWVDGPPPPPDDFPQLRVYQ